MANIIPFHGGIILVVNAFPVNGTLFLYQNFTDNFQTFSFVINTSSGMIQITAQQYNPQTHNNQLEIPLS